MRSNSCFLPSLAPILAATCVLGSPAMRVEAACTQPPEVPPVYSSPTGGIDSPFLFPGEERVITSAASFSNTDSITIAYLPPSGKRTLLVVRASCGSEWNPNACATAVPGTVTLCAEVTPTPVAGGIKFVVPRYDQPGSNTKVVPPNLAKPYRTGPVRLAVSASGQEIPCWLADPGKNCQTGTPSPLACIDHIASPPGTLPADSFDTVTGLPETNDYPKLCEKKPGVRPCQGGGDRLQFAVDANGDILIPMKWTDILSIPGDPSSPCPDDGVTKCSTREVEAATTLPAESRPGAISIPETMLLRSFNENGIIFKERPPRFEALPPTSQPPSELVLSGDTDKHFSVLRIRGCPGGAGSCPSDARYFKVGHRMDGGVGPVNIPKAGYCDNDPSKTCVNDKPCAPSACVRVRADAGTIHSNGASPLSAAPPPPPPSAAPPPPPPSAAPPPPPSPLPRTDGDGGPMLYLLVAALVLGLAYLWSRRGK